MVPWISQYNRQPSTVNCQRHPRSRVQYSHYDYHYYYYYYYYYYYDYYYYSSRRRLRISCDD